MGSRHRSADHQNHVLQKLFSGPGTLGNPCGVLGAASPQLIPLFNDIFHLIFQISPKIILLTVSIEIFFQPFYSILLVQFCSVPLETWKTLMEVSNRARKPTHPPGTAPPYLRISEIAPQLQMSSIQNDCFLIVH